MVYAAIERSRGSALWYIDSDLILGVVLWRRLRPME